MKIKECKKIDKYLELDTLLNHQSWRETFWYQTCSFINIHRFSRALLLRYTGIGQNNGNIWKFQICFISDCCPLVKSDFVQLPSNSFWGNWVLEMVIKLCCNFWSCILVNFPNNTHENLTVPIRQLPLSSRVLPQWEGFSFFLKCCYYFWDRIPCNTKLFGGFCNTSTCHTSTNNLTSFKDWSINDFNEFW